MACATLRLRYAGLIRHGFHFVSAFFLSKNIFPFINTSCVLLDSPTFFVQDLLSILVKNPDCSPSKAHIPRINFSPKTSLFSLWSHIPLYNQKVRFWFPSLFRRGPPKSFSQKPFLFPFMGAFAPYKHKSGFPWLPSLFARVPPISFSQTHPPFTFINTCSPS